MRSRESTVDLVRLTNPPAPSSWLFRFGRGAPTTMETFRFRAREGAAVAQLLAYASNEDALFVAYDAQQKIQGKLSYSALARHQ